MALLMAQGWGCGADADTQRGRDALELRDWSRAEAAFRRALERDPDHLDALYGIGWTYHRAGRAVEAKRAFERCVHAHPEAYLGYKGLGSVALSEGNGKAAERWLQQALERKPDDVAVLNTLALTYSEMGRLDEALALFDRLQAGASSPPEIGLGYAEALLRADRNADAKALIEAALTEQMAPSFEGLYRLTYARTLLRMTTDRLDSARCSETSPPVLAWLDRAAQEVDRAGTLVNDAQRVAAVGRTVARRRMLVLEACPATERESDR